MVAAFAAVMLVAQVVPAAGEAAAPSGAGVTALDRADLRRLVQQISEEHGLDPRLVDAVVRVESDYDPQAVSRRGAMGLMQLMPATARRLEVENPFDPEENIRGGTRELSRLVDRYAGNLQLALAAYNAGEGAVAEHRAVPPYSETRSYVSRILTLYTGRPFRLAATYRADPVRLVRGPGGSAVITNLTVGGGGSGREDQTLAGQLLRGGFGTSK